MKKNKKKKKILLIVLCSVAALIIAAVLLFIFGPFGRGTVDVYPVADMAMEDMGEDAAESYGSVRAKGFQNVNLSDTQEVTNIYVSEGQTVKKGDKILSYDTTLSDIELDRADLDVKKAQLQLQKAQAELERINNLVPASEKLIKPDNSWLKYDPVKTPYLISGKGTKNDPMYVLTDKKDTFDNDFFKTFMPEDKTEMYLVLLNRKHNALNGKVTNSYGLFVKAGENGYSFRPYEAEIPESIRKYDKPKKPYYKHYGSEHTAAEIVTMRAEARAEIRSLKIELKSAQLDYEKLKAETESSIVRAKHAGTVQAVRTPKQAEEEGLPIVEISSGGGYYAEVAISEMQMDTIKSGDTVAVEAYDSGISCEGTITKIATTPQENADAWSNGNSNISYYPCTIFINGEENLTDGEYISVNFGAAAAANDGSFYLENMYIRRDKKGSYVYVKGENGRLEKRTIQIGRILYGSYTQIKDGLTKEDFIAFPYGKKAKPGANTNESTTDTLYGY